MTVLRIRSKKRTFEQIQAIPSPKHRNPMKPLGILRGLIRLLSVPDMLSTKFSYTTEGMEKVGKQPCLILMNHSCFIDLKIAYKIFFPKPICVVSTTDSYVGKRWLMPLIGCIPTHKFVSDFTLINDIKYALHTKKANVLLFPEAGYSLDGRATALPEKIGTLLKRLNVPIVTVTTSGAFFRQPLYNELRTRKVKISAHVKCILTPEEITQKSVSELDEIINDAFSFDNFKSQYESKTVIDYKERANGLERVLYKCPNCQTESEMMGNGTEIKCNHCQKTYKMDCYGRLSAKNGETEFSHIPDWVDWERECVKRDIESGNYVLDADVDIGVMKDHKALYTIGKGRLIHTTDGFTLEGCDGKLSFTQPALASHTLNADFYWYTMGDIIAIGDREILYYCFVPKNVSVMKARLATEEIYKIKRASRKRLKKED